MTDNVEVVVEAKVKKYKCPACYEMIIKANKGHCPECDSSLTYIKTNTGAYGGLHGYYILTSSTEPTTKAYTIRKKYATPSEWQNISQPRDGFITLKSASKENLYKVKFANYQPQSWAVCPQCWKKQFQFNQLTGSLEHKCSSSDPSTGKKCGAITIYEFN